MSPFPFELQLLAVGLRILKGTLGLHILTTIWKVRLMIKTEGLTHIHLLVSDLERSLLFYEKVFGMEERYRDGENIVFLRTPGSRDTVTLHGPPHNAGRTGVMGGVAHFGFRLRDRAQLEKAIGEVLAAGGKLQERGTHASGQQYAYVCDPDGYLIEL
jgi:catechol 2,3-dioxygenase-like lactoylglutathione lyase family enzyme